MKIWQVLLSSLLPTPRQSVSSDTYNPEPHKDLKTLAGYCFDCSIELSRSYTSELLFQNPCLHSVLFRASRMHVSISGLRVTTQHVNPGCKQQIKLINTGTTSRLLLMPHLKVCILAGPWCLICFSCDSIPPGLMDWILKNEGLQLFKMTETKRSRKIVAGCGQAITGTA